MSTINSVHDGSVVIELEELTELLTKPSSPTEGLGRLVRIISRRLQSEVCSVYLLEPSRTHLVLAATIGLLPESVGRVRMPLSEGLVGLVAERLQPVVLEHAERHPRFKYFAETGEEVYRSFMGIPILDLGILQGVLVVQTAALRNFSGEEVGLLIDTARQVAPLVCDLRAQSHFFSHTYERTRALASNLWWSWDHESTSIFRELAPTRWRELGHNPRVLVDEMPLQDLEQRAREMVLHGRINHAYRRLEEYRKGENTWGARHAGVLWSRPVAYFSAEFGIHESLPIYSGGLGVLSGDHIKSASDLGIPLVGIGLFYSQGYFRQRIDLEGWQREEYITNDPSRLPVEPALNARGEPLSVTIDTRSGLIHAKVWRVSVGRNTLYLLDSNVDGNRPEDRELTARLYGGDVRVRIRQELLLGIGGVKALRALNILPSVLHLNEGHSAFATLEVVHQRMMLEGIDFAAALRRVAQNVVFTTHTPVPAGHDRFSPELIEEHLGPLRDRLGLSHEGLMELGRVDEKNSSETFCMTVLALKASRRANAVSCLHGQVSREMWMPLFHARSEEQVPIGHITNGIHVHTWLATPMHDLYDRHLGPEWVQQSGEPQMWEQISSVSDAELWETHQTLKSRLIDFVRLRAMWEARRRGESGEFVSLLGRALSIDTLTIGFARRFATYKRADLVFADLDCIAELVGDARTPVQFVFAGKAHPHDKPGKEILQRIAKLTHDPYFAGKVVFIEDYDINTCRHFVQGVDVWLNNPRRPLEASGTSGQKVVLNGGLNLSILDGWWAEAYEGKNGFAIGEGFTHSDEDMHDQRDGESLFRVLRDEVLPLYYERDRDGLPRNWIARMKRAISTLGWRFNANRMVMDYVNLAYIPAAGGISSQAIGRTNG
ncbi:MAG TPA: alpha-glucan family phosphorylase [Pirellulales bacterium]|jgi:starch phosphorylase|nr:alpha-glucan family phosphorylase [Pirellulales bacterium]